MAAARPPPWRVVCGARDPVLTMSHESYRFVAEPDDERGRLDRFVVARLERAGNPASRANVQRWIDAGRVVVDGGRADPSSRVRVGVEVVVEPAAPEPTHLEPDASVAFVVLHEDEHLIVVDKPAGLVVHPARGHATGTLVHGLLARGSFDRLSDEAHHDVTDRDRPGIVHRLDKGTSGILVAAKDDRTREALKGLFASHTIERAYCAIAEGDASSARYETLYGRHRSNPLKFSTHVSQGKTAITHVRVLERLAGGRATLVECRLETGRTHQIRVHLSECGRTPVLGDPLYGRSVRRDPLLSHLTEQLGHQALHARVLGFAHPITGAPMRFETEPPADFRDALAQLRRA